MTWAWDGNWSLILWTSAYARLKSFLESKGLLEAWYELENKETREVLLQWRRDHDIQVDS
jgi:hypothetical protein